MRHLADRFDRSPGGVTLPLADTAAALGLGARAGSDSPLVRTLKRLRQFDLAQDPDGETLAVRRVLPPVHRRHVRRLPAHLQATHAEWVSAQDAAGPVDVARRRARRVALMLLVEGDTIDATERALHGAGFHPALAYEAVRWARDRYAEITAGDAETA